MGDSGAVRNGYITAFSRFIILLFMLYGYLISNISNAKISPLFYFTLNVESLYNKLQSLLHKLPTDKNGGQLQCYIPNFWVLVNISVYNPFWSKLVSYIILACPAIISDNY